nr:hypothetical protein [uncultured Limnohabitans sp.]
MKTMTITIERKPLIIHFDGKDMQVEELSIRLPFGRKPATMSEIAGSEDCTIYITETRDMEPAEFDSFAMNLLQSRAWLKGKGGYYADGRLCVEVHAPGRPYLFIDPSGSDYGRYVARVG